MKINSLKQNSDSIFLSKVKGNYFQKISYIERAEEFEQHLDKIEMENREK